VSPDGKVHQDPASDDCGEVLEAIRRAVAGPADLDRDARLREVVRILAASRQQFTWTGIYLLAEGLLVLHNQVGRPTPHERIPVGQGICGLAAREKRTVVVPDVSRDSRYLACSLTTRSEIVVPIMRGPVVLGEIDVDSDRLDAFDEADRRLLEEAAALVAEIV
jgi:L-methionine (R)-S-oxide reductase